MNKGYKRARSILILGIIGMSFLVIGIVLIILYFTEGSKSFAISEVGSNSYVGEVSAEWMGVLSIAVTLLVVKFILSITAGLLILTSDFNTVKLNDTKIIFGVLTLILIGSLGPIIFGIVAMNKIKDKIARDANTPVTI